MPITHDTGSANTLAANSNTVTTGSIATAEGQELLVAFYFGATTAGATAFLAATSPTTSSGALTGTKVNILQDAWSVTLVAGTATGADTAISLAHAVKNEAGSTGTIQATAGGTASRHGMIVGAFKLPLPTLTIRPSSDVTTSGWVGTPDNTTLFTNIDEVSPDDADYITSPSVSSSAIFGLDNPLVAGSYDITVRAKFTGSGQLRIIMLDSSNNVLATSSWQVLTSGYTTYLLNVVLAATASRFRIETAP